MNMVPTSATMPEVRTSHWRVLRCVFLLRRLRMNDGLRLLLYATHTCRMNEYITVRSP